jgi:NAD(P)-dependent dehydrogenase (short-subunit alcohol dehydrogenase family)
MNNQSDHPVLVVTGGSRGIGAEVCRLAASRGYRVVMNFRSSRERAEALADEITARGGQITPLAGDVSAEEDVIALFEYAAGLGPLAGLVNNAGILENQMDLVDMSAGRIDRVFAVNVRGSFLCAREAVRRMATGRGGKGGAIVNVSSAAARMGSPHEYIDYAASKGAIDTLTVGLAKEVATEGIRVNAVRPGIIETEIHASGGDAGRVDRIAPMVPMQRAGTAAEVARTILWLLSDEASYMTGALVDVSGGR